MSSLPTYKLSTFKALNYVYKEIERYWRNFLWEGSLKDSSPHLINWDICTTLKDYGGLGIRTIKDSNLGMLSKWIWRYHMVQDVLWKSVIDAKYKKSFMGDIPVVGKFSNVNASWRAITKGKDWFESMLSWIINNGENLSFWYSNWSNDSPLSH